MTSCATCSTALDPHGRFCAECGTPVPRVPAQAAPQPAPQHVGASLPHTSGPPPAAAPHSGWSPAAAPVGGYYAPVVVTSVRQPAHAAPTPAPPVSRSTGVLDGVFDELGRLPLRELLPLHDWWRDGTWRQGRAALFLLTALTPFALLQATSEDTGVERAAVGFAVYFAFLWLVAIRALVRPEPLGWQVLAKIGAFTTVAGVAIAIAIEEQLLANTDTVLASVLTVGLPEEFAKALAILLFLRSSRGHWHPRTYLYAGAVSGLAFGAAEAVAYTTAYASALELGEGGLVVSLWRLLAGSLFHACMAGIVAFFIGLSTWFTAVRYHLLGFGLLVAGSLHGVYNYLSDGWGGTALAALTVFTFVGYVSTGDRIGERLSEHLGR